MWKALIPYSTLTVLGIATISKQTGGHKDENFTLNQGFKKGKHKKFHCIGLIEEEDKNNTVALKLWLLMYVLRGLPGNPQVDLFE